MGDYGNPLKMIHRFRFVKCWEIQIHRNLWTLWYKIHQISCIYQVNSGHTSTKTPSSKKPEPKTSYALKSPKNEKRLTDTDGTPADHRRCQNMVSLMSLKRSLLWRLGSNFGQNAMENRPDFFGGTLKKSSSSSSSSSSSPPFKEIRKLWTWSFFILKQDTSIRFNYTMDTVHTFSSCEFVCELGADSQQIWTGKDWLMTEESSDSAWLFS